MIGGDQSGFLIDNACILEIKRSVGLGRNIQLYSMLDLLNL